MGETAGAAVVYSVETRLDAAEFVDVLRRSGLAARRPVDEPERISAMVENADVFVCARNADGLLIGVSRAVTDFSYCCYLSDLAVDERYQRQGIGRELIRRTHQAAGEEARLLLLSAPAAMDYYPKAGMQKLDNCFGIAGRRRDGSKR